MDKQILLPTSTCGNCPLAQAAIGQFKFCPRLDRYVKNSDYASPNCVKND